MNRWLVGLTVCLTTAVSFLHRGCYLVASGWIVASAICAAMAGSQEKEGSEMKKLICCICALAAISLICVCARGRIKLSTRHTETRQKIATIRQQLDENRQLISQLNDALARLDDRFRQDFEARYPTAEAREAAMKEAREWLRRAKEQRAQGKGGK